MALKYPTFAYYRGAAWTAHCRGVSSLYFFTFKELNLVDTLSQSLSEALQSKLMPSGPGWIVDLGTINVDKPVAILCA